MRADPPPPRRPIRRLSPALVERIAAGEVVERPASVVKELLENAVDAGASHVTVRLRDGGIGLVEVADDGIGIPAGELATAFERHATNKLDPEGPIDRVGTLGFRGEALAAIATVARVRLLSRPPDTEVAEGVECIGGQLESRFAAPRSPGTTVEVRDLFFNTPARRKFLKSPAAEQVEVVRSVERSYLARPQVALTVESEGREIGVYPATASLSEAGAYVLGSEFTSNSFAISGELPGGTVRGALGVAASSAATSGSLFVAVNGRPIVSRSLSHAVRLAFGDALPRARFPAGVVDLSLALDRLDVNVHPTKREVRFFREREIADAIRHAVRSGLERAPATAEPTRSLGSWAMTAVPSTLRPSPLVVVRGRPRPPSLSFAPALTPDQRSLDEGTGSASPVHLSATPHRPPLDLLGPFGALYWVAASDDALVLIDQHAASERLLYETLTAQGSLARQKLVDPLVLELPPLERAAFAAHADEVRVAGFDVEPFGAGTVRLGSVPALRGRRVAAAALRDLLNELADGGRPTVPDGMAERVRATIACHAAVRAGDVIEPTTFARIVQSLDRLPSPVRSCPHGRPIMIRLARNRLDRWFLRQGT